MNTTEINRIKQTLKLLLHKAIIRSVQKVDAQCKSIGNKAQEPDFIASLTLDFTPDLFNILNTLFPKYKFSITGIFCHQKPIVDIGKSKNPELGDILFVYIYTSATGAKRYNSLLLQAKMSNNMETIVSPSDYHQLELYETWPQFTYSRAGAALNGTIRNILPKTFNDGGQYLIVDDDSYWGISGAKGTFPMGCANPANKLIVNNKLSSELVNFFKFKSGRTFEENPKSTADHWTKMIWEMLDISRGISSRRKNAGLKSFPRQSYNNSHGLTFFLKNTNSIFDDLHEYLSESKYDEEKNVITVPKEEGGLSIVLIESTEENEEKEKREVRD